MARLIDRNANAIAHDYATAPYHMSAVYVVYAIDSRRTYLKVGASETQTKDLAELLRGVQRRVRVAVPCAGPRRKPSRPATFVWVVLALTPVVRHELEQALVERFGDRRFDPTGLRRREFCDPASFDGIMKVIDQWRVSMPDALSEAMYSEDGGSTYLSPRKLLPYAAETEGLWVEPATGEGVLVELHRRRLPTWTRCSPSPTLVAGRDERARQLMVGHHSGRVERLRRALRASPAVVSDRGDAYRVTLDGPSQ